MSYYISIPLILKYKYYLLLTYQFFICKKFGGESHWIVGLWCRMTDDCTVPQYIIGHFVCSLVLCTTIFFNTIKKMLSDLYIVKNNL